MRAPTDETALLKHRPALVRLARSLVGTGAEDVVQDAYAAALTTQGIRSPGAWLRGTVRQIASKQHRSSYRRARRETASARVEALPATDEIAASLDAQRQVLRLLRGLPQPFQRTLWMRYFNDLPPRAIAQQLAVPVATVKSQLHRGLQQLRTQLDEAHGGDRRRWQWALASLWRPTSGAGVLVSVAMWAVVALCVVGAGVGLYSLATPSSTKAESSGTLASAQDGDRPVPVLKLPPKRDGPPVPQEPTPDVPNPDADDEPMCAMAVAVTFHDVEPVPIEVVVTDDDGNESSLLVPPGERVLTGLVGHGWFRIRAKSLANLAVTEQSALPYPGNEYHVDLRAYPTRVVRGRVMWRDGDDGVGGVLVEAVVGHKYPEYGSGASARTWRVTTDAAGRFALTGVPDRVPLLLVACGAQTAVSVVGVGASVADDVVIRADHGGRVQGRVVFPDGRPAARALVFLAPPVNGEIRAWVDSKWPSDFATTGTSVAWWCDPQHGEVGPERPPWVLGTRADEDGQFVVNHVELDFGYLATAVVPGWLRAEDTAVTVASERGRTSTSLVLRAVGTLRIRVVGPDGTPQPRVQVFTTKQPLGYTDAEGWLTHADLVAGPTLLWMHKSGVGYFRGDVEVSEDVPEHRLTLTPGVAISGRLVTASGEPLSDGEIYVRMPDFGRYVEGLSNEEGAFTIDALPKGVYTVIATKRGVAEFPQRNAVQAPTEGLVLRAKAPAPPTQEETTIHIAVPSGHDMPEAVFVGLPPRGTKGMSGAFALLASDEQWQVSGMGWPNEARVTLDQGVGTYKDNHHGKIGLVVGAPGFTPTFVAPGLPPVGGHRVTLQPGRVVRGRVLDPDGKPIAGASLAARPDLTATQSTATTDQAGVFTVAHMPLDDVELAVRAPGFPDQVIRVPRDAPREFAVRLTTGGEVTVLIRNRTGDPATGTSLLARTAPTALPMQHHFLGARSRLTLHLPAGSWWLALGDTESTEVRVAAGEAQTITLVASAPSKR